MSIKDEIRENYGEYRVKSESLEQAQKELLIDAKDLMETKGSAVQNLEKIEAYEPNISTIKDLINWEGFETNLHLYKNMIGRVQQQAQNSTTEQYLSDDSASATKGLIASSLVAGAGIAAPTAAVALASTFGVASTGTAIATLSGAAATNATLALIGGGSMATGSAVLGLFGPVGWVGGGLIAMLALGNAHSKNVKKLKEIQEVNTKLSRALSENRVVRAKIGDLLDRIKFETAKLERIPANNIESKITKSLELVQLLNTPIDKGDEKETEEKSRE